MLTVERLCEVLDYNPDTGVFRRKKDGSIVDGVGDRGYIQVMIDKKRYRVHRLAWLYVYGEFPPNQIDHRDRNRLNNAIRNLRSVTPSQNTINRAGYSKSGFKGVYAHGNKWQAKITVLGKKKELYLGTFKTKEEAYVAYCEAARKTFGEFACVPVPTLPTHMSPPIAGGMGSVEKVRA